jgi:hypothetical protein
MTPLNGTPANNTAPKQQIGRPFQPGQSGNPSGRPKGARNKLSEKLLETLATHFEEHGKTAIEKVYSESPRDYLKIVALLVPKQMEIDDMRPRRKAEDLSDDELAAIAAGEPQSNGADDQRSANG